MMTSTLKHLVATTLSRRHLSIKTQSVDHVCVCVTDIQASIKWYSRVLGLEVIHGDQPFFFPADQSGSPAFLVPINRNGSGVQSGVALLPLSDPSKVIHDHNGAHFALRVGKEEFARASAGALRTLLEEHQANPSQSLDVEQCDYGIQRSLFFHDPDANIVELASWGY